MDRQHTRQTLWMDGRTEGSRGTGRQGREWEGGGQGEGRRGSKEGAMHGWIGRKVERQEGAEV